MHDRDGALSEDEQLGVVLVKSGIITIDQLGQALGRAHERGVNLARVLIEDKLLTEEQFVGTLAEQLGLEFVDLATYPVDPAAARLVSETLARRYLALPIGWWEGRLIVAMADPSNVFAIDDIRTVTGAEVRQVVATAEAVTAAINKYHRKDSEAEHVSAEASASSAPVMTTTGSAAIKEVREDAPIVRLVNLLISQAITDRASDIHVEPTGKDVRIRYRIDGVLHEVMRSPRNIQNGMISRLKVMADINIAERRIPQDGRITTTIDGRPGRPARRHPPDRERREGRHADPGQQHGQPAPVRARVPARQHGAGTRRRTTSPTAPSWSPARPARARRRPCTPPSTSSTSRPKTSSRSRTRSSTSWTGSTRSRSTPKPG